MACPVELWWRTRAVAICGGISAQHNRIIARSGAYTMIPGTRYVPFLRAIMPISALLYSKRADKSTYGEA